LERRHKAAATTVGGLLIATVLLSIVAYLGKDYFREQNNPPLEMALRISVGMLGLGAIIWRRTKLSPMRLQDIGALQGGVGLVRTLEKTTLQLAVLSALMAGLGFVATLVTGNEFYTYWAAAIALVILVYSFPTKGSWMRKVQRFT
jgi:hypothetical protein